jgi:hypothetical protein
MQITSQGFPLFAKHCCQLPGSVGGNHEFPKIKKRNKPDRCRGSAWRPSTLRSVAEFFFVKNFDFVLTCNCKDCKFLKYAYERF